MDHARKMVLIPHENIQEILGRQQAPMKTVQTPGIALIRLDTELSEILYSNVYANEREKYYSVICASWNMRSRSPLQYRRIKQMERKRERKRD